MRWNVARYIVENAVVAYGKKEHGTEEDVSAVSN